MIVHICIRLVSCLVAKGEIMEEVAVVRAVRARPKVNFEPPVAARGKGRPKKRPAAMVPLVDRPVTVALEVPKTSNAEVATLLFRGALPSMQKSIPVYPSETQASLAARLNMNKENVSQN